MEGGTGRDAKLLLQFVLSVTIVPSTELRAKVNRVARLEGQSQRITHSAFRSFHRILFCVMMVLKPFRDLVRIL